MLPHQLLYVILLEVLAIAPSLTQDSNRTSSLELLDDSICALKPEDELSYVKPWQEISRRAQGCSVPYYGPQGHGQNPEEVHIVHITEIGRLIETLPNQHQAMITITVRLDSASCLNKTVGLKGQTFLHHQTKLEGNETNPLETEEEVSKKSFITTLRSKTFSLDNANHTGGDEKRSNEKKRNFPTILRSQNFVPYLPTEHFSPTSKRETEFYATTSHNVLDSATRRPLVLLLTSDQPVMWQITPGLCWRHEMASKIQVMVEKDSHVDSDMPMEVIPKTWVKRITRKSIQRYARRTFHGVASFTQIREANSVRISVGPAGSPLEESSKQLLFRNRNKLNFCDFSSRRDSNLVSAFLSVPLSSESCVVGETNLTKSFIVEALPKSSSEELENAQNSSTVRKTGKAFKTNLPSIFVQLTEEMSKTSLGGIDEASVIKPYAENITVVLISKLPTHWILSSSVKHSNICVVTNQDDEVDLISNFGGTLEISSVVLPKFRDEIIQRILSEYGSPVHYFQLNHATGFSLTVDSHFHQVQTVGKFHQQLPSPDTYSPPWSIKLQPTIHPPFDSRDALRNVLALLESDMVIVCGKSIFEIAVPASVLIQFGVKTLHLNDKSCQTHSNGTHFILASLLQSCGSEIHADGKNSVISNTVYADFNDGDIQFRGLESVVQKQTGVPVACSIMPLLNENTVRSIFKPRGDVASEEEDVVKNIPRGSEISSSIYQLELYHSDVRAGSLFPINYHNVFGVNDRIYVRIWMNDAPSAQAVAENCWISNVPHSKNWILNNKKVLLSGMCPVDESVTLEHHSPELFPSEEKSFTFSLQISEDYLSLGQELYIHCQIGVCISSLKYSKGKPILCVDARDYCLTQTPLAPNPKMFSTAHQLLTRGPIIISSPSDETNLLNSVPLGTKCSEESSLLFSSAISVDMIVAIAVCSFVIGAGLTATLWFIHYKTDPTHKICHAREYSLGSRTAVMGSSLSPHSGCSSTNSQSAIA